MIDAYPLTWPAGWKRTPAGQRTRAKFGKVDGPQGERTWTRFSRGVTIAEGTRRVLAELDRFGVPAGDVIISTNLQMRRDGLPLSRQRQPDDPGVAVYWKDRPDGKCMAIDRYSDVAENLAAVAATIAAMRAIERHGGAQILARAFQGFIALPAPGGTTTKGWREVFGLPPDAVVYRSQLDAAYRTLRSASHPDHGGSADAFNTVQSAYEQAKQEIVA